MRYFTATNATAAWKKSYITTTYIHIEDTLKCTCPICAEYLFDSYESTLQLNCGHSMHKSCFKEYKTRSFQCPICFKSAGPTEMLNFKIEHILNSNKNIKLETKDLFCELSCYDCSMTESSLYTFLFNKCQKCGSYNTRINEIFKE